MFQKIILPPLTSGFPAVSKAIGIEIWLELGKPDRQQVLKTAQLGNQDALVLVAIDCVNKGNREAGLKIIQKFADHRHGCAVELLAAVECDGCDWEKPDREKVFRILHALWAAANQGHRWSMSTLIALHELKFFQDFPGLINDDVIISELRKSYCTRDNEISADVACTLNEKGFGRMAYDWAVRSIKRGEIGGWHIYVAEAASRGDATAYKDRLYRGAEIGNPSCGFQISKAIWNESLFLQGEKENEFRNSARDMARNAAQDGNIKALILYGIMCNEGFGGEIDKVEAIGSLMTAYALEPSNELSGLIYRIAAKTPATLSMDVALHWMAEQLNYDSSFRAFAITGYLRDSFSDVGEKDDAQITIPIGKDIIFLKTKGQNEKRA